MATINFRLPKAGEKISYMGQIFEFLKMDQVKKVSGKTTYTNDVLIFAHQDNHECKLSGGPLGFLNDLKSGKIKWA